MCGLPETQGNRRIERDGGCACNVLLMTILDSAIRSSGFVLTAERPGDDGQRHINTAIGINLVGVLIKHRSSTANS